MVASYHKNKNMTFESGEKIDTYRCLSILPASRYFRNNLLNTLCLLIHKTFVGILASEVPFLLPGPEWRPFRFAARSSRVRAREWTVVGLIIMRPSLMSFLTCVREFAFPISACSAGSSQILRWPTLATLAARRFCDRRFTMYKCEINNSLESMLSRKLTHSASGICKTKDLTDRWSNPVNPEWKGRMSWMTMLAEISQKTYWNLALGLRMSSMR